MSSVPELMNTHHSQVSVTPPHSQLSVRSGEVAQAPSVQQLMQNRPQLAQQLMIAMANPKKRKHDESK